ncbi:ABC transporter substrate-binding protein [Vulcanibacillus modesticaldus]|uniref:ABC transporter substrate-binding protein n=1 Tax=Vulcanibacillus modesticaldus TaxID=337097 RepID=A0A1D2YTD8_9BACI|nr:ABC transporter substrate-binding protein [Vulcanibacillus modesticaldus]OEF98964.1 ABC transporter substrate-binding protein [Vulcanibacillus modesticaldus]
MFKKGFVLITVLVLVLGILSGCATVEDTSSDVNEGVDQEQTNNVTETNYPLTIKDDSSKEITINAEPKRIISLIPSNTEILYALGLDGRVVAVTIFDNYPVDVQERVEYVFEDGLNPNIEQIVALNPDLVILGAHSEQLLNSIRALNISVVQFNPQSINAVYETIEKIGLITNTNEKAQQVIAEMKEKEQSIVEKIANIAETDKVRVWVEVSSDLWTSGKGTFIDELITKAGGINIVEENGWVQYSEEKVIEANPQVIFTTYGYYTPNAVEQVLSREGWQQVDAIVNKRVINVDNDLVSRPGPRIIDGLGEIAKILYPDQF